MKQVLYSKKKDLLLRKERGIGFEDIKKAIRQDGHIKMLRHPDQKKYKKQKYMIIKINNYAYVVPYKETAHEIIWITIFPSRKYTKKYVKNLKRNIYEKKQQI